VNDFSTILTRAGLESQRAITGAGFAKQTGEEMYWVRRLALMSALVCAFAPFAPPSAFASISPAGSNNSKSAAPSSPRDKAERQFDLAQTVRDALNAIPENKRTEDQYLRVVKTYRTVYQITPFAQDVPAAIMAVGDLYRTMGQRFDKKYSKLSVDAYQFLLHDYPQSKYREQALFSVAQVQKDDLKDFAAAQKSYQSFIELHPHSSRSAEAHTALVEIPKLIAAASLAAKAQEKEKKAEQKSAAVVTAVPTPKESNASQSNAPRPSPGATSASENVSSAPSAGAPAKSAPSITQAEINPSQRMEAPSCCKSADLREIKTWATPDYTRLQIALNGPVTYKSARIENPSRIYFDISKAQVDRSLLRGPITVQGDLLKGIRVAQNSDSTVRVVIEISKVRDYSVYLLRDPYRMVVDVYPKTVTLAANKTAAPVVTASAPPPVVVAPAPAPVQTPATKPNSTSNPTSSTKPTASATNEHAAKTSSPDRQINLPVSTAQREQAADAMLATTEIGNESANAPKVETPSAASPGVSPGSPLKSATADVKIARGAKLTPPPVPSPNSDGQRSLTRALGLKIGRIVIDAGHGGHDTGTIGPTGLMEKDLCLDVALRLGKMIEEKLPSAEVVYTRSDDTFIPLEQRTVIANEAKADLFISIHANSSPDHSARGVETYYLNFSASPGAMEVASRENALAQENVHDLADMVQRIARNEKIEESKDLAGDIQQSLSARMKKNSPSIRDRGVRKAPFVVLIGANMPSVLAEISFISNPTDEQLLKKGDTRQHVAEGLYRGVEAYLQSTNSLASTQAKTGAAQTAASRLAPPGNQR
jgi:N-acetylmuramoyl-L-alanine amidase